MFTLSRWERIKKAYDALVHGKGTLTKDIKQQIQSSYDQGVTDEFIEPLITVDEKNQPIAKIDSGDVIVFFNYRTDRGRQLTEALSQVSFLEQEMVPLDLHFVTLTNYNKTFKKVNVIFEKDKKDKRQEKRDNYFSLTLPPWGGDAILMFNRPPV